MSTYLEAGAEISPCGRYRYKLWRTWDIRKPLMLFIMLNPSTADGRKDDPTIRSCVRIANANGCGAIMVVNLYAWRATEPRDLPADVVDACGPRNAQVVRYEIKTADIVVCAWGQSRRAREGYPWIARILEANPPKEMRSLGLTSSGAPRHPLFVKANTPLERYRILKRAA